MMATVMAKRFLVLLVMFWLPCAVALENPANTQPANQQAKAVETPQTVAPAAEPKAGKGKVGPVFWAVLALAFLFVLGSALAVNAVGGKRPPPRSRDGEDKPGG